MPEKCISINDVSTINREYGIGIYDTLVALDAEIPDGKKDIVWWPIILAIVIFLLILIFTRGRILFFPGICKGFGGGRTGGGRARR